MELPLCLRPVRMLILPAASPSLCLGLLFEVVLFFFFNLLDLVLFF